MPLGKASRECRPERGPQGASCTAVDNGNGTKTITCAGSPPVTVANGQTGAAGGSCTVVDNGDQTKTIRCADGTQVIVSNGAAGTAAQPCTILNNGNGTATIRCPDGASVTYAIPRCGDGQVSAGESCDGDVAPADGCNATCSVEAGWSCDGQPSQCLRAVATQFTVSSAPFDQDHLQTAATSDNGSVVVWLDQRNQTDDLYAQKYDSTSAALWATNGAQLFGGSQQILEFSIAPSTSGGVFVAWANNVGGTVDIKLQLVRADGTTAFGAGGVTVGANAGTDREPAVLALPDGGALVAWWNQTSHQVFVQKVGATGAITNGAGGLSVSTSATVTQRDSTVWAASPARDFIYLVWVEATASDERIRAMKVRADGTLEWPVGEVRVSDPASPSTFERYPAALTSGTDLLVTWMDGRNRSNASFANAYAQKLAATGARMWFVVPNSAWL